MKREERERLGKLLYELERKEFKDSTIPWEEYSDKGGYRRIAQAFAEAAMPDGVMLCFHRHDKLHVFQCFDEGVGFIRDCGADCERGVWLWHVEYHPAKQEKA